MKPFEGGAGPYPRCGEVRGRELRAELLCDESSVVVNEDTGPKTAGKAYWNVFVPTALGGGSGGAELTFTPHFTGEGWPLGAGPFPGEWDEPSEVL